MGGNHICAPLLVAVSSLEDCLPSEPAGCMCRHSEDTAGDVWVDGFQYFMGHLPHLSGVSFLSGPGFALVFHPWL